MRSLTGLGRASASVFGVGLATLAFGPAPPAEVEADSIELAAQAAYLYKLAPFVTWPGSAGVATAPLVICVQGEDPFGPLLDRAVAGRRVAGRPLLVRRAPRLVADSGCAIVYVAGSAAQSQVQALAVVERTPVLTVTDAARGPARGIVHLVRDRGTVRISIDTAKANYAGVKISSKLLALSVVVTQ